MRSAIIGSNGFLGKAIATALRADGHQTLGIDRHPVDPGSSVFDTHVTCDIRDREGLVAALQGVDEVYHVAAFLGTSELEDDLRGAIDTNVLGSLNVFEAALRNGARKVFFASKPSVWLNTYTITKHSAEQIARHFARYYPLEIVIMRYLNIYGPGQKLYPVRKILPVFAAQALRNRPIQVFGDGQQTVDMMFVRDAARITVDLMRVGTAPDPMDCGTGVAMSVLDVAKAVNEYFGSSAGVALIPMRKGETPGTHLVADVRALRTLLPDMSFTPWPAGLAESLAWYAALPSHHIDAALAFHGLCTRHSQAWN
jgi:UDP-glucose 4-epimerase